MGVYIDEQRPDVYYCEGCGYFYDARHDTRIEVGLHELSAEFALEVMHTRQFSIANRKLRKVRGFSNTNTRQQRRKK